VPTAVEDTEVDAAAFALTVGELPAEDEGTALADAMDADALVVAAGVAVKESVPTKDDDAAADADGDAVKDALAVSLVVKEKTRW
jgi:hypothetical protein